MTENQTRRPIGETFQQILRDIQEKAAAMQPVNVEEYLTNFRKNHESLQVLHTGNPDTTNEDHKTDLQ